MVIIIMLPETDFYRGNKCLSISTILSFLERILIEYINDLSRAEFKLQTQVIVLSESNLENEISAKTREQKTKK